MLLNRSLLLLASAAFLMNGCVAADKYNALKLERDQYLERLGQAESEARAQREKARLLQQQLDALLGQGGDQQTLMQNMMKQNADLKAQIAELNRRYEEALRKPVQIPVAVANELQALANQYPDLLKWDAARGMLKFTSDVTFASGSDALTPRAREVITRVAQILNSPSVAGYDLLVAGHTDSVRVTNPKTIQLGHKDNWYLSAHRAISVGSELRRGGTADSRLGVVGYADQHPVASNASDAGKAQNRRVEVLILPPVNKEAATGDTAPAATPAPAETIEVNK